MSDYEYNQDAARRAAEAAKIRAWAEQPARVARQEAKVNEIARWVRITIAITTFAVIAAILAPLAGCNSDCANPFEKPDVTVQPVDRNSADSLDDEDRDGGA